MNEIIKGGMKRADAITGMTKHAAEAIGAQDRLIKFRPINKRRHAERSPAKWPSRIGSSHSSVGRQRPAEIVNATDISSAPKLLAGAGAAACCRSASHSRHRFGDAGSTSRS